VLTVLAHLIERGEYEELHEIIKRQGRQIERNQARCPRARAALNGAATLLPGRDRAPLGLNCQCGTLRAPIRAP
jgi:hypothetical protein